MSEQRTIGHALGYDCPECRGQTLLVGRVAVPLHSKQRGVAFACVYCNAPASLLVPESFVAEGYECGRYPVHVRRGGGRFTAADSQ